MRKEQRAPSSPSTNLQVPEFRDAYLATTGPQHITSPQHGRLLPRTTSTASTATRASNASSANFSDRYNSDQYYSERFRQPSSASLHSQAPSTVSMHSSHSSHAPEFGYFQSSGSQLSLNGQSGYAGSGFQYPPRNYNNGSAQRLQDLQGIDTATENQIEDMYERYYLRRETNLSDQLRQQLVSLPIDKKRVILKQELAVAAQQSTEGQRVVSSAASFVSTLSNPQHQVSSTSLPQKPASTKSPHSKAISMANAFMNTVTGRSRTQQTQHQSSSAAEEHENDSDKPAKWFVTRLMENGGANREFLKRLHVVTRSGSMSWVDSFVQNQGQVVLAQLLKTINSPVRKVDKTDKEPTEVRVGREYAIVCSLRAMLDVKSAANEAVKSELIRQAITQSINSPNLNTRVKALDYFLYLAQQDREALLDSLDYLSKIQRDSGSYALRGPILGGTGVTEGNIYVAWVNGVKDVFTSIRHNGFSKESKNDEKGTAIGFRSKPAVVEYSVSVISLATVLTSMSELNTIEHRRTNRLLLREAGLEDCFRDMEIMLSDQSDIIKRIAAYREYKKADDREMENLRQSLLRTHSTAAYSMSDRGSLMYPTGPFECPNSGCSMSRASLASTASTNRPQSTINIVPQPETSSRTPSASTSNAFVTSSSGVPPSSELSRFLRLIRGTPADSEFAAIVHHFLKVNPANDAPFRVIRELIKQIAAVSTQHGNMNSIVLGNYSVEELVRRLKTDQDARREELVRKEVEHRADDFKRQLLIARSQLSADSADYVQQLKDEKKEMEVANEGWKRRFTDLQNQFDKSIEGHTQDYSQLKIQHEELFSLFQELRFDTGAEVNLTGGRIDRQALLKNLESSVYLPPRSGEEELELPHSDSSAQSAEARAKAAMKLHKIQSDFEDLEAEARELEARRDDGEDVDEDKERLMKERAIKLRRLHELQSQSNDIQKLEMSLELKDLLGELERRSKNINEKDEIVAGLNKLLNDLQRGLHFPAVLKSQSSVSSRSSRQLGGVPGSSDSAGSGAISPTRTSNRISLRRSPATFRRASGDGSNSWQNSIAALDANVNVGDDLETFDFGSSVSKRSSLDSIGSSNRLSPGAKPLEHDKSADLLADILSGCRRSGGDESTISPGGKRQSKILSSPFKPYDLKKPGEDDIDDEEGEVGKEGGDAFPAPSKSGPEPATPALPPQAPPLPASMLLDTSSAPNPPPPPPPLPQGILQPPVGNAKAPVAIARDASASGSASQTPRLKQIHWDRIDNVEDTIWSKIQRPGEPSAGSLLEKTGVYSKMERLFVQREIKRIVNRKADAEQQAVSILRDNIKQSVDINFHRFRFDPVEQVVLQVLHCKAEVIDNTSMLEFFANPQNNEIGSIGARFKPYSNTEWSSTDPNKAMKDPNELRRADHLYLELFYNLRSYWLVRSKGLVLAQSFDREYKSLMSQLDMIYAACDAAQSSRNFHKLLEIVLHMGNYMNGPEKQARGFRLSFLLNIIVTKDDSSEITLLHFVESTVRTGLTPEVANFTYDLQPTVKVADLSIEGVKEVCEEFVKQIQGLNDTLSQGILSDSKRLHPEDRCVRVIRPAVEAALPLVEKLKSHLVAVEQNMKKTMSLYGEDYEDKEEKKEFFGYFAKFISLFNQIRDDNMRREEERRVYDRLQAQYREREKKQRELDEAAAKEGRTNADAIIEKLKNPDMANSTSRRRRQDYRAASQNARAASGSSAEGTPRPSTAPATTTPGVDEHPEDDVSDRARQLLSGIEL